MKLDEMIQGLIGVGASIAADCRPCLESCLAIARHCGADEQDIEAAEAIGRRVRDCAQKMVDGQKETPWAGKNGTTACCGFTAKNR